MNWSDLRIFLAIAQQGSLRAAADALGVTQPTVARRLHALELDIGVPLFERSRDGHHLTAAGQELLPEVRTVETAVLRVEERSLNLAEKLTETVRISAGQTSAAVLARGLHLLKGGPTIELVIADDAPPKDVRAPDIFLLHDIPNTETGTTRRVGSINCAVYGAKKFSIGRALPLSETDLSTLPWLGFAKEQEHFITMQWLRKLMHNRPPVARLTNTDLMESATIDGVGVAVLPCFKGDNSPQLIKLSEQIESLRADYWTLIQPDLAKNPSVRTVTTWIIDCFRHVDG